MSQQELAQPALKRSMTAVAIMAEAARDRGLDIKPLLLEIFGFGEEKLHDPEVDIRAEQEIRFIERLVTLCDDEEFTLECAARTHLTSHGIFGYMLLTSRNLEEALHIGLRFLGVTAALSRITSERSADGSEVILRINVDHLPESIRAFVAVRDAAAVGMIATDLTGMKIPLTRLWIRHEQRAPTERYLAFCIAQPEFGMPEYLCAFRREILEMKLPYANPMTHQQCIAYCLDLLDKRRSRQSLDGQVREYILQCGSQLPGLEEVAEALNMSSRTLRRRLADSGTSYRELLEEVRENMARLMLSAPGVTVQEVSERLGYTEVPSFSVAFKRWTGLTPSEYRGRQRSPAEKAAP